jgi:putative sugar O-methyltransferase
MWRWPNPLRAIKALIQGVLGVAGYSIVQEQSNFSVPSAPPAPSSPTRPSVAEEGAAIMQTAAANLVAARDAASRAKFPAYGSRWQALVDRNAAAALASKTPTEVLHYAQIPASFDHRRALHDSLYQLYANLVQNEFPWFVDQLKMMSDNPFSVPSTLVMMDGRLVSNVLFYHARILLRCVTALDRPIRNIIEIGGGYGALARLWFKNPFAPIERYTIVDVPESLIFSDIALRQEFGDVVCYFDGQSRADRPIVLVPVCHLDSYSCPVDLVINTASMQEMTDDWIDFYMAWLDQCDAKYFYSLNYAAQPISEMGESRTFWAPRPSRAWSTSHLNPDVPLMSVQGLWRNYLEAIYEKSPAKGTLADWSLNRGRLLTRQTYVEGLDLLRQNFNEKDAATFLETVLSRSREVPKELLWIAKKIHSTDHTTKLAAMVGGERG